MKASVQHLVERLLTRNELAPSRLPNSIQHFKVLDADRRVGAVSVNTVRDTDTFAHKFHVIISLHALADRWVVVI